MESENKCPVSHGAESQHTQAARSNHQWWPDNINLDNYSSIVELAKQPENVRGYGHIKIESIKKSSLFKDLL